MTNPDRAYPAAHSGDPMLASIEAAIRTMGGVGGSYRSPRTTVYSEEVLMEEVPPDLPPACETIARSWSEYADELIRKTPPEHRSAFSAELRNRWGDLFALGAHPAHARAAVKAYTESEKAKLDEWEDEAIASTRDRQRMNEQGVVFAGGEHSVKPSRPFTGPADLEVAALRLTDFPPPPTLTTLLWRIKYNEGLGALKRDIRAFFGSSREALQFDTATRDALAEEVIERVARHHDRQLRTKYLPSIGDSINAGDFQLAGRQWSALYMRYSQFAGQGAQQAVAYLQSFTAQAAREQQQTPDTKTVASALQDLLDQSRDRLDKELYISLAETIATDSPEAKRFGSNTVRTVLADAFRAPQEGVTGGPEIAAYLETKYKALPSEQGYAYGSYLGFLRSRGLFR